MGSLPLTLYTLSNPNCRIVTLSTLLMVSWSCLHGSALLTSYQTLHWSKIIFTALPHYINSCVCYGVERTVNELDRLATHTVTVCWTFNLIISCG